MKSNLYLRSMAFIDNDPYLLIREKKKLFVAKLNENDTIKVIRQVPLQNWWGKLVQDEKNVSIILSDLYGVIKLTAYPLNSESRGRRLSKDMTDYYHIITATGTSNMYFLNNYDIYTYRDGELCNLDKEPQKRLQEEEKMFFFLVSPKGLHRHSFSMKPGEWELLCEITDFKPTDYKQIAYNPISKQVSLIGNRHGLGWAYFIDMDGNAKKYSTEKGLWSVVCFQGRFFFYEWGQVVELTSNGNKIKHKVDGVIARNQCLFATNNTLYFVCEDRIHKYKNDKWSTINFSNHTTLL